MTSVMFAARGTPRPQPRPRFVNGRTVSTADANAKLWRVAVTRAIIAADAEPIDGAVELAMAFTFGTPIELRYGLPHTYTPDVDNLAKLVMDVMELNGLLSNDSKVARLDVTKRWGAEPGVTVVMTAFEAHHPDVPAMATPDWLQC